MLVEQCYCDGGVIGPNPSLIGGTWSFIWVSAQGVRLKKECGVITPEALGVDHVTNNDSELLAALMALESLPEDWTGTLYTDSQVTRARLLGGGDPDSIPTTLYDRLVKARSRASLRVVLLAGHPTKKDLIRGWKSKDSGRMSVSEHNVECDRMCSELAHTYQK